MLDGANAMKEEDASARKSFKSLRIQSVFTVLISHSTIAYATKWFPCE